MGAQLVEHGICASREDHAAHFEDDGSRWCRGYPEVPGCPNCDDRRCMACIFREVHDECADDCPFCCPPTGGTDDSAASRSRDLDEIEDMLGSLAIDAATDALRAFRTRNGF